MANVSGKGVIILNKPFSGDWLQNTDNIGHEIIDFLKTDKGELYAYNIPYGSCPDNIEVNNNVSSTRKGKVYYAKYLVLTSVTKNNSFDIKYVLELEEKLHHLHYPKSTSNDYANKIAKNNREIDRIVTSREIKYNGKAINKVEFGDKDVLCVTFKVRQIYEALAPIHITSSYNYQRNKGYIYEDVNKDDYNIIIDIIEQSKKDERLKLYEAQKVEIQMGGKSRNDTFLDFIGFEDSEQVYTNALFKLFNSDKKGDLFKAFCNEFNKKNMYFATNEKFDIKHEWPVNDGRLDICAESKSNSQIVIQRVIIENKVYSGLNGIDLNSKTTQLTVYYKWGIEQASKEPLCFILLPDSREKEIEEEIRVLDPKMNNIYVLIKYGEIANFLKNHKKDILNNGTYKKAWINEIIKALENLSHSYQDQYTSAFLKATTN